MTRYTLFFVTPGTDKIGLNQDFMVIDTKKDAHKRLVEAFLNERNDGM